MNLPSFQVAALLLATAAGAPAQAPAPAAPGRVPAASASTTQVRPATPPMNHNLVFLDPAHGGPDDGGHLGGNVLEKDVTLALADRIRKLLAGNGLSVVLAREADAVTPADGAPAPAAPAVALTPDQRAGTANHLHPVACILLHATSAGNGVHIVTSALAAPDAGVDLPAPRVVPWETAQTDSLAQSARLGNEIAAAVAGKNLPVHLFRASVKPIDSLTCPAVAVEVAPLLSGPTQVSDEMYQQRVSQAVASALLSWRGHADPPQALRPVAPDGGTAAVGPGVPQ